MMPSRACGAPGHGALLAPFLIGKTSVSMTFSEFQRAEQLLIKGGAATKPPETILKKPERLIKN